MVPIPLQEVNQTKCKEKESDLAMVDCGEIEVIHINPDTGAKYDGHCIGSASTGAHATL